MPLGDKAATTPLCAKTLLSSVDVFDLASGVREELEKVVEIVGNEPLILLVSRVVDVLEHLDRLNQALQTEREELESLRLIADKQRCGEMECCQKEKEILEQSWKQETAELTDCAVKLQEENLVLRLNLEELRNESHDRLQSQQELSELTEEICTMRERMYRQKDELMQLKKNLVQKETEIEALQLQLGRFAKLNADYVAKCGMSDGQVEQPLDEEERKDKASSEFCSNCGDFKHRSIKDDCANKDKTLLQSLRVEDEDDEGEEAVQGPVNEEPEEKLFPEKFQKPAVTAIQRMFQNFLRHSCEPRTKHKT